MRPLLFLPKVVVDIFRMTPDTFVALNASHTCTHTATHPTQPRKPRHTRTRTTATCTRTDHRHRRRRSTSPARHRCSQARRLPPRRNPRQARQHPAQPRPQRRHPHPTPPGAKPSATRAALARTPSPHTAPCPSPIATLFRPQEREREPPHGARPTAGRRRAHPTHAPPTAFTHTARHRPGPQRARPHHPAVRS